MDSYTGIFNAYQRAFEETGVKFPGTGFVKSVIGAPLTAAFEGAPGMDASVIPRAVGFYRAYYQQRGMHEVSVYEGMEDTLRALREAGCFLGVATLKRESFARRMLEEQGLLPYFHAVCGMDPGDRLTKADLIRRCVRQAGFDRRETILVGDSAFDAEGARQAGVAFLAVTYGYGFSAQRLPSPDEAAMTADSPREILTRLRPAEPSPAPG